MDVLCKKDPIFYQACSAVALERQLLENTYDIGSSISGEYCSTSEQQPTEMCSLLKELGHFNMPKLSQISIIRECYEVEFLFLSAAPGIGNRNTGGVVPPGRKMKNLSLMSS